MNLNNDELNKEENQYNEEFIPQPNDNTTNIIQPNINNIEPPQNTSESNNNTTAIESTQTIPQANDNTTSVIQPNINNIESNNNTTTEKKKKGKKKFIFLGIIILIILASFISKLFEPDKLTKTDYIEIEQIYVDDSIIEDESEELRTVYVFYTAKANKKNLQVDAKSMYLKFDKSNTYESKPALIGNNENFFANYYYSSALEDIYVGSTLKIMETFEIPKEELTPGKTIKFINSNYPDTRKLKMSTDDIKHMNNFEEIAKDIDSEAYYKELDLRTDADPETTNRVKNALNDYYWKFYTNMMWYKLEFFAPNNFKIDGILSNQGTYYVKKGYVALSYDNGYTYSVYIKYNFKENGDINLEVADSFSVL